MRVAPRGEDRTSWHAAPVGLIRNQRVNMGARIAAARDYTFRPRIRPDASPWACHPVNAAFLRKFLDLALTQRVAVFWALFPRHPQHVDSLDPAGQSPGEDAMVRAVVSAYPNVTIIDGRAARYGHSTYWDGVHFCRDGARVFSHDVAGVLREALDSPGSRPRLVRLPDYRDLPYDPALDLEDTEQSRRTIRERVPGRALARETTSRGQGQGVLK